MKKQSRPIIMVLAAMFMLAGLTMTVAAEPMAGVVDMSDPTSNPYVVAGIFAFFIGLAFIVVPKLMELTESKKWAVGGVVIVLISFMLFATAVYVPEEVEGGAIYYPTSSTTYDLIMQPANNTAIATSHVTYYTWGVDFNTTTGLIENVTNTIIFNETISRTGGAITDKVLCYIEDSSISVSDSYGIPVIAKSSGICSITWTADGGASVTGLSQLPVNYPADSETSAHYVTCGVTLSSTSVADMVNNGVDGASFIMTFQSEAAGIIGTGTVNMVFNTYA